MNIGDALLPKSSKTLLRAAKLLETQGWVVGQYRTKEGEHCAIGALDEVCGIDFNAYMLAANKLAACIGGNIVSWNDKPGQTAKNVIKTMRECARS